MNKKTKLSVAQNDISTLMFTGINRPPIKIADQNKSDSADFEVVEGEGISAAVVALPLLKSNKHPKRAWRVLQYV